MALAAEGGWRDFFGLGADDTVAEQGTAPADPLLSETLTAPPATEPGDDEGWMVTSPLGNVTWPEIKMPKFEFSPPWGSPESGEEGWFAAPIARTRLTANNAMQRTRTAWNGTIERMKFALPGSTKPDAAAAPQIAAKPPGFLQRMLGPPEPELTTDEVVEMMAQERAATQR